MPMLTAPSPSFPHSSVFSASSSSSTTHINPMLLLGLTLASLYSLFLSSLFLCLMFFMLRVVLDCTMGSMLLLGRLGFLVLLMLWFRVLLFDLPERYTQAVLSGTAASGVLVSTLRIFTKAVYPQDASGLQKSAYLYFAVIIVIMFICMVFYTIAPRLPVIKYYNELKINAVSEDEDNSDSVWRSTLWDTVGKVKWYGFGIMLLYVVTLAIFPGYITEDVHSHLLKDWYPILLITCFNVFDLVGKCLTAVYLLENAKVAIASCLVRLLFFPLFLGCLHGPKFFRTVIPVTILTCLLGLTNGYLTSVLMILAPKTVKLQHAETAGIVSVLFLVIGLAAGSIVSWFWVI